MRVHCTWHRVLHRTVKLKFTRAPPSFPVPTPLCIQWIAGYLSLYIQPSWSHDRTNQIGRLWCHCESDWFMWSCCSDKQPAIHCSNVCTCVCPTYLCWDSTERPGPQGAPDSVLQTRTWPCQSQHSRELPGGEGNPHAPLVCSTSESLHGKGWWMIMGTGTSPVYVNIYCVGFA